MKTIRFKENGIGRYSDVSPFPLGALDLELKGIPDTTGEYRFVGAMNGKQCVSERVTAAQNRVSIPSDKLTAGKFSCRVIQYMDGKEVRIFKAEDLLITDVNGDFSAVPEIVEIREEIKALQTALAQERAERKEAEAQAQAAKEYTDGILFGLVRFAYKDFKQNVYLDGTSNFDGFLQAFGIALSDEDKGKIKGE